MARCPVCQKVANANARPFCSKRCADVDLHRWLAGAYAIPASASPDDETPDTDAEASRDRNTNGADHEKN